MGFLSTFITQQWNEELPDWFKEKYQEKCIFLGGTLVASKQATKILYQNTFFDDFHAALVEIGYYDIKNHVMYVSVLAENGFVSLVEIAALKTDYSLMEHGHDLDSVYYQ